MLIYYCLLFYANIISLIVIKSTERDSIVIFSKIEIHTHESYVQLNLNWIDPIFLLQLKPEKDESEGKHATNATMYDDIMSFLTKLEKGS